MSLQDVGSLIGSFATHTSCPHEMVEKKLLTLAGVVIRLFSVATESLAAMAAMALVDLLLCLVMAKGRSPSC